MSVENVVLSRLRFAAARRSILSTLGLSVATLACGPGMPGGEPPDDPITATGEGSDSQDSLTSASTSGGSESDTVTDSVTDSASAEDSTTWACEGYTEEVTETFCVPPTGATEGSDGGTLDDDSATGTGHDTDVATSGVSTVSTSGGDTGTRGGLCDALVGDTPPGPEWYDVIVETVGPYEREGQCCWDVTYQRSYPCGRPFFVDEVARVASVHERRDWCDAERPDVRGLDEHTRARLAEAWLTDALAEHASIAAFARFALQLLALGAPADLLAETHRAMEDELEHARLCFAIASAYAGRDLGPGVLPIDGALLDELDLAGVVVATIREGCIGETLAAMQADVARGLARDAYVAAALDRIATDEARHAALAWRFVDWAIKHGGGSIRDVAAEAFHRFAPPAAVDTPALGPDLQPYGRLGASDLALLQRRTYDEVIRPCAAAVLALPATGSRRDDQMLM